MQVVHQRFKGRVHQLDGKDGAYRERNNCPPNDRRPKQKEGCGRAAGEHELRSKAAFSTPRDTETVECKRQAFPKRSVLHEFVFDLTRSDDPGLVAAQSGYGPYRTPPLLTTGPV